MHDDNIKDAASAIALYMPYNKPAGTNIMQEYDDGGKLAHWARMREKVQDNEEVAQDVEGLSQCEQNLFVIKHLEKFSNKLQEDEDYITRYCECIEELLKSPQGSPAKVEEPPIKNYDGWEEVEMKELCRLEMIEILKACKKGGLLSNSYIVGALYKDRLVRNGFYDFDKEEETMSSGKREASDDPTDLAIVCDESDVVRDGINIDAEEQARIARRRSKAKLHAEKLMAKLKN
jgi:hypothetical protein